MFGAGVASVAIAACAAMATAEDGPLRGEDRARTFLVLRIAEALDLSDDKALQISRVLKTASERREAIRGERAALAPDLESAISGGEDSAIEALVTKALEIDRRLLLVVADSFEEIGALLTVAERGRFALLVPELQSQLRRGGRRGAGGSGRE